MGVLRFEPKKKPIHFVTIEAKGLPAISPTSASDLRIHLNQATIMVPDGVDPETLQLVIQMVKHS